MTSLLQQAVAAHQAGNLPEAERFYRDALKEKPGDADALALLGALLDATGDRAQAIPLIEKAIALDPEAPLFRLHLGNALMNVNRAADAAEAFRAAIRLQPGLAVAHSNLALALAQGKNCEEAIAQAQKSVVLAPDSGEGWLALCNVAAQAKNYGLAAEAGLHAAGLLPGDYRSWLGHGAALNRLDRHEEAIAAYKHALALKPDRADIWDNLGQSYQFLNRLEEAEAAYRRAVEAAGQAIAGDGAREVAEEEYGHRHWHLALMELLRGHYKEGFARYRARFAEGGALKRPRFSQPLWRGEDLAGKTLVVTDEQGFGDALMLCRFLPVLRARGIRVVFAVHPALAPLFRGWAGADLVLAHGEPLPPYDFYATIFDLPHRLGTTLETVPADIPYLPLLEPDDATRLEDEAAYRVGVAWSGNPQHGNDAQRSVPLSVFAGLFDESFAKKGIRFYSLNRDSRPGDANRLARHKVTDLAPRLANFADAARFIRQCDLVIACDTAAAHLAGGMGAKTWTLLPFAPDWRWLLGRDAGDPWYPAMKLFRQRHIGDWGDVIARVKEALAGLNKG